MKKVHAFIVWLVGFAVATYVLIKLVLLLGERFLLLALGIGAVFVAGVIIMEVKKRRYQGK